MGRFEVADENKVSKISEGTVIKGEIISPNDMRIDGAFEGKMVVKGKVTIGESASIMVTSSVIMQSSGARWTGMCM